MRNNKIGGYGKLVSRLYRESRIYDIIREQDMQDNRSAGYGEI